VKIAIVGAGAMGSLFGGILREAAHEVWLVDIWEAHMKAINSSGLRISGVSGDRIVGGLRAVSVADQVGPSDLVVVFVKSTVTEAAVFQAKPLLGPRTLALTLQNGLGNVEKMAATIPRTQIVAGTTAQGATVLGPGEIRHAGKGLTTIGELDGSRSARISELAEAFNAAGLETGISDNVLGLIWGKLLVNVGINALTALTGLKNGQLLEHSETAAVMERAVREAAAVARAKGIRLPFPDPVAHTRQIARATAENRSSMLQDVSSGRKTEIDMINGAIVREGASLGLDTPVNAVLTDLVKMMERGFPAGGMRDSPPGPPAAPEPRRAPA
jgi:2-dehydropantoate 2-reductase